MLKYKWWFGKNNDKKTHIKDFKINIDFKSTFCYEYEAYYFSQSSLYSDILKYQSIKITGFLGS